MSLLTFNECQIKKKGFGIGHMRDGVGVLKEIDKLGRLVIPKEFRDRLLLGAEVEVVLTEDGILVRNPEYKLVRDAQK